MRWKRRIVAAAVGILLGSASFSPAQDATASQENPSQQTTPSVPLTTGMLLLKEGTEVNLKLAQKLTAKSAVVGEPVELVLAKDLKVNDLVVVRQGARALGTGEAGKKLEKRKLR